MVPAANQDTFIRIVTVVLRTPTYQYLYLSSCPQKCMSMSPSSPPICVLHTWLYPMVMFRSPQTTSYHRIFSRGIFAARVFTIIWRVARKNIVGARIRKARKDAKPPVTQLELVARLQVLGTKIDQGRLSKIETGQRPVSDIEIAAIAKALRIQVSLLFENPKRNRQSPKR